MVTVVNDPGTKRALQAERMFAAGLGATCRTPLGAFARLCGEQMTLAAFVGSPDGTIRARVAATEGHGRPLRTTTGSAGRDACFLATEQSWRTAWRVRSLLRWTHSDTRVDGGRTVAHGVR